jgi:hypothetical protein
VRRLGRIRQAKAGEGGLVARRELVGRGESGEQWEGRVESSWWGEQQSGEQGGGQQGEQRARVADVRSLFYFF